MIRRLHRDERGAQLVEFAIAAPLLFILIFGMIEFGWLFAKNTEVRHGAREAARLAIVDFGDEIAIRDAACARMGISSTAPVTLELDRTGDEPGDAVTVIVTADAPSLTGVVGWILPAGFQLTSEVDMYLEQGSPSWTPATLTCP